MTGIGRDDRGAQFHGSHRLADHGQHGECVQSPSWMFGNPVAVEAIGLGRLSMFDESLDGGLGHQGR